MPNPVQFTEMSDEEFLAQMNQQVGVDPEEIQEQPVVEETNEADPPSNDEDASDDGNLDEGEDNVDENKDDTSNDQDEANPDGDEVLPQEEDTFDYKGAYQKLTQPIKANGKDFVIKNVDEAVQLAQLGLNYTKKMQEIASYRPLLHMIRENELTDPDQLAFLIDIKNKNPEAIRKLLKESEIDPLDIDITQDVTYTPQTRITTNQELTFDEKIKEIQTQEGGVEFLEVAAKWDSASHDALMHNPAMLDDLIQHKTTGIYDTVAEEVERRRALGLISPEVAFLTAYHAVGYEMYQPKQVQPEVQQSIPPVQEDKPKPVGVSVGSAPKNDISAKALAAGGNKGGRGKSSSIVLSDLSDEALVQYLNKQI